MTDVLYKTGISFGSYDPLHYGHIRLLQRAKQRCDKLVVCVSDNNYIKKHKGHKERIPLLDRLEDLQGVCYIDYIDIQSLSEGKKELVKKHKADVIFVGDDWTPKTFTGEGLGVPVVYLPHTPEISSTKLWKEQQQS